MVPYIILLTVPVVIAPFIKDIKINRIRLEKFPLTFFFFMLAVLVALRHESVGNDTPGYIYFFTETANTPWDQIEWGTLEIGFQFYMKAVSLISDDPQFFLAISSVVICALLYPTYRRLCEDPSLTIVLFSIMSTFVMMFSGIRQMMAVGIGFVAYEFARRKKLIFCLLAVILAMQFHTSAFMLLFLYPVYHMRLTKKWVFVIVPALVVIFIFNQPIFSVIGPLLGEVTRFDVVATSTGAYSMIILFGLFTAFAFLVPDNALLDQETLGLRNLMLLALTIQFFAPVNFLAMRMNYYFIIFIPLLMPRIVSHRSQNWNQVAIVGRYVMVFFFFAYFFYNAYTSLTTLHVFPYHFYWENLL